MKVIFYIVAVCLFILFAGRTEISFNPFYIRINGWLHALGWLLIIVGVVFIQIDARRIGYDECQHIITFRDGDMRRPCNRCETYDKFKITDNLREDIKVK